MGAGMEEIYQITSALKHLSFGKHVALLTDARFSGVSTGACIGHVGPEALAGGPIGKVRDGDRIQIVIDRNRLEGNIDLVGDGEPAFGSEEGTRVLARLPVFDASEAKPKVVLLTSSSAVSSAALFRLNSALPAGPPAVLLTMMP